MILYLFLCGLSVLAGCGLLGLIGIEVDRRNTVFLAPVITLCFCGLMLGGLVAGGFTVGSITPIAYAMCLGAAILGGIRHGKTILTCWRPLLVLAGLPVFIFLPFWLQGIENYSGGLCLDGWSYVTAGTSFKSHPLGAEGWLPMSVQYTAQWGKAMRFMSPAFLALLAPLSGEHQDTQDVFGRYFAWLFFAYGSACLFFAKAARLNRQFAWAFVFLCVLSGWS